MFCQKCGQQNSEGSGFCSKCGNQMNAFAPPTPGAMPAFVAPSPSTAGNGFSTAGIILGVISFLFFPIIFGPAGLILGAVGKSKGESKAVTAMVVSGIGLVAGMIIGALVFASY
jgi:hypothetical protein